MENIEQIIQNSKTIKQLTRDISTIAKNSGGGSSAGGSQQGKSGVTGINKVDAKIDDIKDAFANNSTVQFLKDPAGVIGKGIQGMVKPFTDIPGKIGDGLKKLNPFGKGDDKKIAKLDNKALKQIQKNTANTHSTLLSMMKQSIVSSLAESVSAKKNNKSLSLSLNSLMKKTRESLTSGFLNMTKADKAFEKARNFFTGKSLSEEEKIAENTEKSIKATNRIRDSIKSAFGNISNMFSRNPDSVPGSEGDDGSLNLAEKFEVGFNSVVNTLANNIGKGILGIGNSLKKTFQLDLRRDKKTDAADQARREAERDRLNREKKASRGRRQIRKPGDDKKEDVKKGGIFAWIKQNILGLGAGALGASAGAAAGGIGAFFTGLTAIMTKVGTALPFYVKGALALSALALPLLAFGKTIPILVKGLDGLTFEKLGLFAGLITTVGLIAAGLGALIATGVGGLALAGGIAAIALLGVAIGGFGAGVALGEKGFNVLVDFFNALSNVPYLGLQILALGGLGGALAAIGGGGLLARFSSGPLDNITEFLDKIRGGTLVSAAAGLNRLAHGMERVNEVNFDTDFTKSFKSISSYSFRRDLEKAADGMESFLKKVGKELNKLDVSKLDTLIEAGGLRLQSVNGQGFILESGQRALDDNGQGTGGFVNVDNSTTSGNTTNTFINQQTPIANNSTMAKIWGGVKNIFGG